MRKSFSSAVKLFIAALISWENKGGSRDFLSSSLCIWGGKIPFVPVQIIRWKDGGRVCCTKQRDVQKGVFSLFLQKYCLLVPKRAILWIWSKPFQSDGGGTANAE